MKLPPALLSETSLPSMNAAKYSGPTPNIHILLIDPWKRQVRRTLMRMHPDDFRKVLGKSKVSWAKLGVRGSIDIMLAGDPTEQTVARGHRWFEPEFHVGDDDGVIGPLLHGKAAVFGFSAQLNKATSIPEQNEWLEQRISWNDGPGFSALRGGKGRFIVADEVDAYRAPTALTDQQGED